MNLEFGTGKTGMVDYPEMSIPPERICRICGKNESDHPVWLVKGDWTHDFESA